MAENKFRIIYFGTDQFSASILEKIILDGIEPDLVVTTPPQKSGRGLTKSDNPIIQLCKSQNIPYISPENLQSSESRKRLKEVESDFLLVVSYGKILPSEVLAYPKVFPINLHPSLLPKWRGPSPIQSTLLNGDGETGVTLICMNDRIDSGDIIMQESFAIDSEIDATHLEAMLVEEGSKLIQKCFDQFRNEEVVPMPQDNDAATYSHKIKKEDGEIDWQAAALKIHNQVRALQPWPGTFTLVQGKRFKILDAKVCSKGDCQGSPGEILEIRKDGKMLVGTSEGCIEIGSIQLEGKKPMDPYSFSLGFPIKAGDLLGR